MDSSSKYLELGEKLKKIAWSPCSFSACLTSSDLALGEINFFYLTEVNKCTPEETTFILNYLLEHHAAALDLHSQNKNKQTLISFILSSSLCDQTILQSAEKFKKFIDWIGPQVGVLNAATHTSLFYLFLRLNSLAQMPSAIDGRTCLNHLSPEDTRYFYQQVVVKLRDVSDWISPLSLAVILKNKDDILNAELALESNQSFCLEYYFINPAVVVDPNDADWEAWLRANTNIFTPHYFNNKKIFFDAGFNLATAKDFAFPVFHKLEHTLNLSTKAAKQYFADVPVYLKGNKRFYNYAAGNLFFILKNEILNCDEQVIVNEFKKIDNTSWSFLNWYWSQSEMILVSKLVTEFNAHYKLPRIIKILSSLRRENFQEGKIQKICNLFLELSKIEVAYPKLKALPVRPKDLGEIYDYLSSLPKVTIGNRYLYQSWREKCEGHEINDDYYLHFPQSDREFLELGSKMALCIGGECYRDRVAKRTSQIIVLRDKISHLPKYCLEYGLVCRQNSFSKLSQGNDEYSIISLLTRDDSEDTFELYRLNQAKGCANSGITQDLVDQVTWSLKSKLALPAPVKNPAGYWIAGLWLFIAAACFSAYLLLRGTEIVKDDPVKTTVNKNLSSGIELKKRN